MAEIKSQMKMPADYLKRTGYRLPTETEWEYYCRAGTITPWSFGGDDSLQERYGWNAINSKLRTWPVGQKRPNDFGLFDVHGNVLQWCQDEVTLPTSASEDVEDTKSITDQQSRVLCGGSFYSFAYYARSAYRSNCQTPFSKIDTGLRLARTFR
jgi:formylglycine-generating enzyme required for sulfatase activity